MSDGCVCDNDSKLASGERILTLGCKCAPEVKLVFRLMSIAPGM
jgi:hypothetical protein